MGQAIIPFLDLTRQIHFLRPQLEKVMARVTAKGIFILGPSVARFEKEFARLCKVRHGVGVASGTDALELALRALRIGPGDGVAVVSFTFLSTVEVIRKVGAWPLFVDIDPATYTMDPDALKCSLKNLPAARRRQMKLILPVHLYGHPCQMDEIQSIARREDLQIVEDCAQAHGAQWRARPVGSFGQIGCFSFYPTKNLPAHGDGGMAVTGSSVLAARLKTLRVQGRKEKDLQLDEGLNSRLDELQAAILRVKLAHLPQWIRRRQALARQYDRELFGIPGLQCPHRSSEATHAFCLYVIRTRERERLKKALWKKGVMAQVYYPLPVHRQPLYRRRFRGIHLPQTDCASRQVLALPIFPELREDEVSRVGGIIRRFFSSQV